MKDLSPFHAELLDFLKRDVARQIEEGGYDPKQDPQLEVLQKTLVGNAGALEAVERYRSIFIERGPIHLEKKLIEAFNEREFADLGLKPLRIYRGLPRLYDRENPAKSYIKKNFNHLPTLKRSALERAIFSCYANEPVHGKIALLNWVMNDGLGHYIAAVETIKLLKERFPSAEIHCVTIAHQQIKFVASDSFTQHFVPYESEVPLLPAEILHLLRDTDLILQIPTFYPHTEELIEALRQIESSRSLPSIESIGEYGFVETSWFHPKSGRRAMGLHFLEKGILIRKPNNTHFGELENETLLQWLFGSLYPGPFEIDAYFSDRHFYLAYLSTPTGSAIYLYALLKSLEHDPKGIDICVPDLGSFLEILKNREFFESAFGIQAVEVLFESKVYRDQIKEEGKVLRILCPGAISLKDFQILLNMSGEFVGIRGNQSFSEAVSANKVFFYDGRDQARYFLKDLVAIAENRVRAHPGTVRCFRALAAAFLHNLSPNEEQWVEESYFQQKEDWKAIALKIGLSLQNPDTIAGFKKLNRILSEELSCNEFLCHLVQRAFAHKRSVEIAQYEQEQLFKVSFPLFASTLRRMLL